MDTEKIILLETNLDHLSGEELGHALESLNGMPEILDAIYLPGIGKKNRPCGLLRVICRPEVEITACDAIFRHTHALGIRRQLIERYMLPRASATLKIENEEVLAKIHELQGETYIRPEADALKGLANKLGVGTPALRFHKRD